MRLKRLELFGFKSFADRTALEFPRSLTGIVGPNGCGKSNVVDGVRWVLGEQRPTSMRGGEMSDVIFKGSTSRPAMGVAEVSLVLDNSNAELAGHGAEVSITRRVFKSGEGEYLINGERVRLKDVRDMLFDTGLGSRGYAVLEQGRIDAVLSQNPLDRRSIFEEAAGISRFRMRKRETESRLKRVEADMLRLEDVLRELATRVRSLKIQAGKAERFVSARDDWRRERARLLRQRLQITSAALEALHLKLEELEARSAELRAARETGEEEVGGRGREQSSLSAEMERLGAEISRLSGESRALSERRSQLESRILAWRESAGEESARGAQLTQQSNARREELSRVASGLEELKSKVKQGEARAQEVAAALNGARNEYRATRERSEAHNEEVLRALHEKTAAANSARLLDASRGPLMARRERALARFAENDSLVQSLRESAATSAAGVEATRLSLAVSEQDRDRLRAEFAELESSTRELEAAKKSLELERASLSSRIAVLRDFEREREGLDAGAKALLAGIKAGTGPISAPELSGLFADHLHTSTDLARALDAALGERALGLVARSPETALRAAQWLKERRQGQVRVVVAGMVPEFALRAAPEFSEEERGLIVARLCDEVAADADFELLSRYLIGDVFIAADVAACLRLAQSYPQWRFATREGDLVDAAGFVGGHREIVQGAVGRRSSADKLERTAKELSGRITALEAKELEARTRREELLRSREGSEQIFEDRRQALARAERESHTARARLSDLESALSMARRESDTVAGEVARLDSDLAAAQARVIASEAEFAGLNRELGLLEQARHEQETRRDQLTRDEHEVSLVCARLRAELEGQERRRSDLARNLDETQLELERSLRLAREHAQSADAAVVDVEALVAESDALLVSRGELEQRLAAVRSSERAARESIEAFRRRLDLATRELESVVDQQAQLRLEEQRSSLERSEALARAQEDLGLDEVALVQSWDASAGAESVLEPAELAALERQVATLKQELDRIGPVNTEAVVELTEADGRFTFLDEQRKDLSRARATLAETLSTINEESVRLFLSTFEEVRENFQLLFRQLFGGGKADLELQQGVDPLEAGIEISARPPGREMLPIGLLSGGQRTMTALALLFAVFKARPSPFCILDEVDAALDDANIGRFLGMLDSFRQSTQFVVVTHNKGSMAACEGLYGITMEVKGVSRYVAVEFGEVERFDPHATGNASLASQTRDEVHSRAAKADSPHANGHSVSRSDALGDEEPDRERTVELVPVPRDPGALVS
ncbi:MAG TPA: chromosome segregation protein SMC [Planctomycetota bacterium]|nr:chromosome segregation protein SMC [Planctomycetota bacterium]